MRDRLPTLLVALLLAAAATAAPAPDPKAEAWVRKTLKRMTLEEKVGQLVVPGLNGVYTPLDSDAAEKLDRLARERRVGGFHVFGGAEALPPVLLNAAYGTSGGRATRGQPLAIAALLNRLQRASALPLLFTADFEGGAGYIVEGATRLPRAMAIGATRDPGLAERAGRLVAGEGRALGVHVDFYPVVDVNNNPANPIINVRSFGEDPAFVGQMAVAYMKGIQAGGMLSTAKHFPGHGDTATDTHLDLAVIEHPRSRLDAVELVPFKAVIAAGIDAVMSTHIRLPALDPTEGLPATLSRPILTGLLRTELGFSGLVFTDSMSMLAISRRFGNEKAAAMAVAAGADVVLDPPDPEAALRGIREAVEKGEIPREQLDRSVERLLRAKALLGLHRARTVDVEAVPAGLGGRTRQAVAVEIASRAMTLAKDDRAQVPLRLKAGARVLVLSMIDYATGWREGAPGTGLRPRAEEALRRRDRGRGLRPRDGGGDGPRPRPRPEVGRGRGRDLREDRLLQRADGARRGAGHPAGAAGRRRDEAVRGRGLRQPVRGRPRSPGAGAPPRLRLDGRAGGGGGARAVRRGADRRQAPGDDPRPLPGGPRPGSRRGGAGRAARFRPARQ